jgi:hypothetical protein
MYFLEIGLWTSLQSELHGAVYMRKSLDHCRHSRRGRLKGWLGVERDCAKGLGWEERDNLRIDLITWEIAESIEDSAEALGLEALDALDVGWARPNPTNKRQMSNLVKERRFIFLIRSVGRV